MTQRTIYALGARPAATYSAGESATVVALQGSSEGTRNFALYEHLHRRLPATGIGVLTFDRRGEGKSTGEPSVGQFETQVRDALSVIDSLGPTNIGLWGFSQGAWIASLVAMRERRVKSIVGVGACGVTPEDQMLYGVCENLHQAGFSKKEIDQARLLRSDFAQLMRGTRTDEDSLNSRLREASVLSWWPLAYLPNELPSKVVRRRWVEEMSFDPIPSVTATSAPILFFYGEHDEWVPIEKSVRAWRSTQKDNLLIDLVPDVGHNLLDVEGAIPDSYDQRVIEWFLSTLL